MLQKIVTDIASENHSYLQSVQHYPTLTVQRPVSAPRFMTKSTIFLFAALLILSAVSLLTGAADVTFRDILALDAHAVDTLVISRMPRLLAILCTGAGMAIAGLLMQRIEVLRGQQRQHAGLFQLDQRLMRSAGLRIPYWRFLLPAPSGPRKSGMPADVEMPAPVNTAIFLVITTGIPAIHERNPMTERCHAPIVRRQCGCREMNAGPTS